MRRRGRDGLGGHLLRLRAVAAVPLRLRVLPVATEDLELHAAVLRVRLFAVAGVERAVRAEADAAEALRVDAVGDERLHDRVRARLRELQVVGVVPAAVGVPTDLDEVEARVRVQYLRDE